MPIGKYKDFASCVAAQKRKGLNDTQARKYCGAIQAKVEGNKKSKKSKK